MKELTRDLLTAAAEVCGWPRVELGSFAVGAGGWRDAVTRATPGERLGLLQALGPFLLCSTEGGAARLEAWHRRLDMPVEARQGREDEPLLFGDIEALPAIRAALALMPDAVRHSVLMEVAFLAVGRSSKAWTGSASLADRDGVARPRLVVVGPKADMGTLLHESAHVFLSAPPGPETFHITAQGEASLFALATAQGWRVRASGYVDRGEILADALAVLWLFSKPPGLTA